MIYKIMTKQQWQIAQQQGRFTGSEADIEDGFIHFSTAAQLRATVAKHFAQQTDLVLLAVDESGFSDELKWERSRDNDLFPHLYGILDVSSVRSTEPLPLNENGEHIFPESLR